MTSTIPFIKMHGAGNDFVFLDRQQTDVPVTRELAKKLLDRHFGVGGDQLLVLDAKGKHPRLDIYNSDGSTAEMCGNGVRAVAFYLTQQKGYDDSFTIMTKAGPIGIGLKDGAIDVDMGKPILEGKKIPVNARGEIINRPILIAGKKFLIHAVSMGNPHCVIFVKNVREIPLEEMGPLIEHHPFFPNRVNVEFVQVINRNHLRARIWERGAGATLACGTGACAIGVAAARADKAARSIKLDVPGGQLKVRWAENDHVFLSGPAEVTFAGQFQI